MANNKILYTIIFILVLIVIGGAYLMFSGKNNTKTNFGNQPKIVAQTPAPTAAYVPSEQPNQAKYNEYLSDIYLGKMAIGKKIGDDGFPTKTVVFTAGTDLFCSMMTLKKTVPANQSATAIYDVVAKTDSQPKSVFPRELPAGGTGGCSSLSQGPGKYEYKLYFDDVLAVVLPFEVK